MNRERLLSLRIHQLSASLPSPLSNALTADFQKLEYDGDHTTLCERYASVIESLGPREQASLLRSFLFNGRKSEYERWLPKLELHAERVPEVWLLLKLSEGILLRQQGRHEEALERSEEVLQRLDTEAHWRLPKHLLDDLRFGRAISLVEMNRMFLGLDEFQQIGCDSGVRPFRRTLCKLNEGWILWDLGRTEAMKAMLNEVPAGYRRRFEISLASLEGDTNQLIRLYKSFPFDSLPMAELRNCALLLAEASVVFMRELGNQGQSLYAPLARFCREQARLMSEDRTYDAATWLVASSFLGRDDIVLPKIGNEFGISGTWRAQLRYRFFSFLRLLRERALDLQTDPELDLRSVYESSIVPVLEERHLRTPLVPTQLDELIEGNAWHNNILRAVSKAGEHTERGRAQWRFRLDIDQQNLEVIHHDSRWDVSFESSPSSLRLLEILAWTRERRLPKRYLHEQLTPSRYVAGLHDSRLHKLLQRLSRRIEESCPSIPRLFEFRRDNHLHLNFSIEVMERGR